MSRAWLVRRAPVLCLGGVMPLALSGCANEPVTIVNDTLSPVRLSGCFIDDALDLNARDIASEDIPSGGLWGCVTYDSSSAKANYVGCLIVQGTRTYRLSEVDKGLAEKACDRIG